MKPLPHSVTDEELITFVDGWASLLERGDYEGALALVDQLPGLEWTAAKLHEVISWVGPHDPNRRVTLEGAPTDLTERKVVSRHPETPNGFFGEIWYSLNIDGTASDLVATFALKRTAQGITVHFEDIAVR